MRVMGRQVKQMHNRMEALLTPFLKSCRYGIERESLRYSPSGELSAAPHPSSLGSPLTHPYIGTDFGEQQLEWNTPPLKGEGRAEHFLEQLMRFTLERLGEEWLWPFSMPGPLKEPIAIAKYGASHEGRRKEIYREGLSSRYGKKLQMISGIHFNFSWDLPFWKQLSQLQGEELLSQEWIDRSYFGTIRNFLREGWLLTYLFGSSPAIDPSYCPLPPGFVEEGGAYIGPYATSIRMSNLGYYNRVQNQIALSFEGLPPYIREMKRALSTHNPGYAAIPSQLNAHLLQIENEHYGRIRPKGKVWKGESTLQALEKGGVAYLEVRAIDIDPYHPTGISPEQIDFLTLFLTYCLLKKSPPLSDKEQRELQENQNRVALEGRREGLLLQRNGTLPLKVWGLEILKGMEGLATLLGKERLLRLQQERVKAPSTLPSALIERDIRNKGWKAMGRALAQLHKECLLNTPLPRSVRERFEKEASTSKRANGRLEEAAKLLLFGYEEMELSTQLVMKKAQSWGITTEVIDPLDQLICLKKGEKVEYLKQATRSSKEGIIVSHLLQNKQVTKQLVAKAGLTTPVGRSYTQLDKAELDYPLYAEKRVVVKPNQTNCGIGITFVEPGDERRYREALNTAFSHDRTLLVEEFTPGEEIRFLVIEGAPIYAVQRLPAHVVGDGRSTIQSLVNQKNNDPSYYRHPAYQLQLGTEEKRSLKARALSPQSILKQGEILFLRSNSNVSTGGDAIDVTDRVHSSYKKIALQATEVLGAKICGVDILVQSMERAATQENYAIIELNDNPVLFFHAYPYRGKGRDVAGALLKLLG